MGGIAEIKGGIERHAAIGFNPSSHLLPDRADGGLIGILVALAAMLRYTVFPSICLSVRLSIYLSIYLYI
jgi:hypothetical protein